MIVETLEAESTSTGWNQRSQDNNYRRPLFATWESSGFRAQQKQCPWLHCADEVISRLSERCVLNSGERKQESLAQGDFLVWRMVGEVRNIFLCSFSAAVQGSCNLITSRTVNQVMKISHKWSSIQVCKKTHCLCWLHTSESVTQSRSLC